MGLRNRRRREWDVVVEMDGLDVEGWGLGIWRESITGWVCSIPLLPMEETGDFKGPSDGKTNLRCLTGRGREVLCGSYILLFMCDTRMVWIDES